MTKSEAVTALYAVFNAPHNADINIAYLNKILDDLVAAEREACAELVWPKVKVWSEDELTAMTGAFNQAQEKHGWYETLMAVAATALKGRAAAIRSRNATSK